VHRRPGQPAGAGLTGEVIAVEVDIEGQVQAHGIRWYLLVEKPHEIGCLRAQPVNVVYALQDL
jgi:hypothetical protein